MSNIILPSDTLLLPKKDKKEFDEYRGSHGEPYKSPTQSGYSSIPILEFLKGVRFGRVVMAYVHALNPTWIRVTRGECTTDSIPGRVTITVDEEDKVLDIDQEVCVAYWSGHDLERELNKLK